MNIQRQTKLPLTKQLQIEDFVKKYKIDILHIQEIEICEETFCDCNFISESFNILSNNSENGFGTASLIRADLEYTNVKFDTTGRAIVFDIGETTFGNFYAHSGTDNISRSYRENFFSEIIPSLLVSCRTSGCIGGDLNSITEKIDATAHPVAKMSPSFKRLTQTFNWKDSYRHLHPSDKQYSRYFENTRGEGATRIDRCYHYGDIAINYASYEPLAFSDHHAHIINITIPTHISRLSCPKGNYTFRIKAEVVNDSMFQDRLREALEGWLNIKSFGLDVLVWWENIVKPGIKKLAQKRSREMSKQMKGELNLLRLRQIYLNRKLSFGETWRLSELKKVHLQIEEWYSKECNKIKYQSQVAEHLAEEKVRVYHHELHKRRAIKSSILKLQTPTGIIEGHTACAEFLENTVEDLLLNPAQLNPMAQSALLENVEAVFTEEDNKKLLAEPTRQEVIDTLAKSHLHAAPGTDGLTSYFYHKCFNIIGDSLTEVITAVFNGNKPTLSQRTSKMVFGCKPNKTKSLKPGDKRRISLLNTDFKIISGIESIRFKDTATRTLSPLQLVAGEDRRIHHGINLARDAIQASSSFKSGCGIADMDYKAAFDFLVMSWVFMVLEKKGVSTKVINRLKNLYHENFSIIVVNNIPGKIVKNYRLSLRQGDKPSMFFFAFGIDPLLTYLEKRLTGILVTSLPVLGPVPEHSPHKTLPVLEERYKLVSYADDLKPAITTMHEFILVNNASALFEAASGCVLHRDPTSNKCKFLPLGKWRKTLQQEDLPVNCQYLILADHLDMVGVELRATWTQTRKANGDILQERVSKTINPWRAGKFMPLSMRPSSVNSFVLSKVWFRCGSVDLRVADINAINSSVKSWLYGDMFEKPPEMVMCRPTSNGGLGVHSVKFRAQALLIRTFMETAAHPQFTHSLLHSHMFQYHVLENKTLPDPGFLPYYPETFFRTIRNVHEQTPLDVKTMSISQWARILTEDCLTMEQVPNQETRQYIPCSCELLSPNNDWQISWKLCRLRGLSSEMTSFNFKLLHRLLPVKARLHKITPATPATCTLCPSSCPETLEHALLSCSYNAGTGQALIATLQRVLPSLTSEQLLLLQFVDVTESQELPLVFFSTAFLLEVWNRRVKKGRITLYEIRTTLEAKCSLLRETKFQNVYECLEEVISLL